MFPEVVPIVTVTELVPCPAVIVAPVGADQVYDVAPETAVIEYAFPVELAQGVAVPDITPGVAGIDVIVIALVLAAEVPQELEAVTDIFPDVAPIVTVTDIVP
jgi:hypothetical protein